jgi:hypothetical protein
MNVYHEIEVLKKRIRELENETGHRDTEFGCGSVFSFHDCYYLMVSVEPNVCSLISIHTGNRWKDETIHWTVTFSDILRHFDGGDVKYIGQAEDVIKVV